MRVILRPINRHTWSNVVKYKNCYDYLEPYYTRSGNIYTGMGKEDAERLGAILGKNLLQGSDFWKNFFVRIGADDVFLETEDPLDEIKYIFCKNHKRVKSSIFERKATADYLLVNKDEEAKRENLFNKSKIDAIVEFRKMSLTDMRKCLRLFGQSAENVSGEVVENTMFKFVEANPTKFLDKWVNNKTREIEFIIERAISKNVLRRTKNIYKYGSDVIGYSIYETIDFLNNPKNQDIKISMLNAIDAKESIVQDELSTFSSLRANATDDKIEKEPSKYVKLNVPGGEEKIIKEKTKSPKIAKTIPNSPMDEEGIDLSQLDFTT